MLKQLVLIASLLIVGCNSDDKEPEPIDKGVFPVSSIETNSPDEDFEPLHDIIGNAEIVGLGESVHTSGGFYQAKFRLFKWLVEHKGFRAFGFESPWHTAKIVENYVATCEGDPLQVMGDGLFGVWYDQATYDLIVWMCQWNTENPDDKVVFYGWDAQNPWADSTVIQSTLSSYHDAPDVMFSSIEMCIGALAESAEDYYYNHMPTEQPPQQEHELCLEGLNSIEQWFNQHSSDMADQEYFDTIVALTSFRGWQGQIYEPSYIDSFDSREEANAKIIDFYRELKYPGLKTALWAHNAHIWKRAPEIYGWKEDPDAVQWNTGANATGSILANIHGDNYRTIGLFGYDVDINWGNHPDRDIPTNEMSMPKMIYDITGFPYAIIDFNKIEMLDPNVRYQEVNVWMRPHEHYDGGFYLEHAWESTYNIQE